MKRILQVLPCLAKGGTEAFVMNNYRNIDRTQFDFDFLIFNENYRAYEAEIKELGGKIYYSGYPSIKNVPKFIKKMVGFIKQNGPYDVVHSHATLANSWVMVAARLAGVPIRIAHSHDSGGKDAQTIGQRIYFLVEEMLFKKFSTNFLACSDDAGRYLFGKKLWEKRGMVIKNGIDVERFIKTNGKSGLGEEFRIKDKYVFGNITRFEPKKNITFIVDIFAEVLKKKPDSILLLGGVDGGQLAEIKDKVECLGLTESIRFIGVRDDVADCLKLIDMYLFPSLYEGLGIVLLEAQASGVYCIASTGVSPSADMGLGLVKFLDLSEGTEKWAEKICNELDYKKPGEEDIKKAFAEAGFDINVSVKALEKIYMGGGLTA